MAQRMNKRMRQAKGSLEKILESLRPYLPKKQTAVAETVQNWQLPEDDYGDSDEKRRKAKTSR